jgi:hypothetical protein
MAQDVGYIYFSTAITAITFDYTWDTTSPFNVTFYQSDGNPNGGSVPFETVSDPNTSDTETFTFDTDVTELQWIGENETAGIGGITSLSYTLDGPPVVTPEPGELLLSAFGLAAVFGLALALRS